MPYQLVGGLPVWTPETPSPGELSQDVQKNLQASLAALQAQTQAQPEYQQGIVKSADLANRVASMRSQYGLEAGPLQQQVDVGKLQLQKQGIDLAKGAMTGVTAGAPTGAPDAFSNLMSSYQQIKSIPGAEAAAGVIGGQLRDQINQDPTLGTKQSVDQNTGDRLKTEIDPTSLEFKRTLEKPPVEAETYAMKNFGAHYFELPADQRRIADEQGKVAKIQAETGGRLTAEDMEFRKEVTGNPNASDKEISEHLKPAMADYLIKGSLPIGRSQRVQSYIIGNLSDYMKENGISEKDLGTIRSNFQALNNANKKLTDRLSVTSSSEETVLRQMNDARPYYDNIIKKFGVSEIKKFNQWRDFWAKNINDPDVAAFNIFMDTVPDEFAKVVVGGGTTAMGDREKFTQTFWNAFKTGTPQTYNRAQQGLSREMRDREIEYQRKIYDIQDEIANVIDSPKALKDKRKTMELAYPKISPIESMSDSELRAIANRGK